MLAIDGMQRKSNLCLFCTSVVVACIGSVAAAVRFISTFHCHFCVLDSVSQPKEVMYETLDRDFVSTELIAQQMTEQLQEEPLKASMFPYIMLQVMVSPASHVSVKLHGSD